MIKTQVDRKFDEIIEFSGVEKFLETPVKRYSSGMRVRLAFAVAAHLEPEILIIDEVLAVGDAAFQRKCLDKMEDVGKEGRTVLFVSHSMQAISRMCGRAILLNQGKVMLDGDTHGVVSAYLKGDRESSALRVWSDSSSAPGGKIVKLRSARIMTEEGDVTETYDIRKPICVEMEYEVIQSGYILLPTFSIFDDGGVLLCVAIDQDQKWRSKAREKGTYKSKAWIPGNLLGEGQLTINMTLWTLEPVKSQEFYEHDVLTFQVIDSLDGDSVRGHWQGDLPSAMRPMLKWETEVSS